MRVLVVEDQDDMRSYLKTRLQERCFAVDAVEDGEKALYQAKVNDYDIILLDYDLPSKNGFEICEDLRKNGKHTPIIMLSVTGHVDHKIDGFHTGIDDYVTKPFYFDELFARMQSVLRRAPTQQSSVFEVDDLVLDSNKQKVMRDGKPIYLTRKEFSLLEYLMKHAGSVVSRGELMDHVWDVNLDIFSNTIETHVLNLRRKINHPDKPNLIHSVPGRGYKIDINK